MESWQERSTDDREAGRLVLLTDIATGGPHYYLNGIRLKEGDRIELAVADGSWISGTYCWSGHQTRWPGMRIRLARRPDADERARSGNAVISIPPEEAIVRFAGQ